ncbi:MAG: phospholipid carrier-dependent glycosyltransferase [Planctomycetota bacterium]|nr:phospholipid carrier-dependent glycosyltransferase [Planctomycetota bacterium]
MGALHSPVARLLSARSPTPLLLLCRSRRWDLLIRLAVVASIALFVFMQATKRGLGLFGDSGDYVECARSVLRGEGMLIVAPDGTRRPMAQFPPLYPLLIAAAATLVTGDDLVAARALHGFCLVVSVILVGWITYRLGRSAHFAAGAALLVALSGGFQGVHVRMYSEACFVALVLAGVALVYEALARREVGVTHRPWLVAAALALGAAALARYAGMYFIATGAIAIAFLGRWRVGRRVRLADAVIFAAIAALGLGLWFVRNRFVAGQPARHLAVHPPGAAQFQQLWAALSAWSFPIGAPAVTGTLAAAFAVLLVTVTVYGLRRRAPIREQFTSGVAGAAMGYVLFLLVSFTFADAAMPFDYRILIPMLPLIVIALASGASALLRRLARSRPAAARRAGAAATLLIATMALLSAFTVGQFANNAGTKGLGYAASTWRTSPTLKAVRRLPRECVVWSNAPDAIRLLLGREARPVPMQRFRTLGRPNMRRFNEIRAIGETMHGRGAGAVVWFDLVDRSDLLVGETIVVNRLPVGSPMKLPDGRVYLFDPTPPATAPTTDATTAPVTTRAQE